jgi:hypothetical protein
MDEEPLLVLLNASPFRMNVFYEPQDRRFRLVLLQSDDVVLTDWVDSVREPHSGVDPADMAALRAKSVAMCIENERRRNSELMKG